MVFRKIFSRRTFLKNSYRKAIIIALFSLFGFSQWAHSGEELILTFYITNSGIHSVLGTREKPDIILKHSMKTSSKAELVADPPSLAFTDSPLKFFRAFLEQNEYGYKLAQTLSSATYMKEPLEVLISAAGASVAEEQPVPSKEDLAYYVDDGNKECFDNSKNKQQFLVCMFKAEIARVLPGRQFPVYLQHDADFMSAVSVSYVKAEQQKKAEQPAAMDSPPSSDNILMLHTTTCAKPYRVKSCEVTGQCKPALPRELQHLGGTYQMGTLFREKYLRGLLEQKELKSVTQQFRDDLKLKKEQQHKGEAPHEVTVLQADFEKGLKMLQQKKIAEPCNGILHRKVSLLSAIYSDCVLHQAYHRKTPKDALTFRGAPYMLYRLFECGKGYTFFGDKICDIILEILPGSTINNPSSCIDFEDFSAFYEAKNIVDSVKETLLDIILIFYYSEYKDSMNRKEESIPQLVLAGEEIEVIEHLAKQDNESTVMKLFRSQFQACDYKRKLWELLKSHNITTLEESEFTKWIDEYAKPLIGNMKWIPSREFYHYLHAGAQMRLIRLREPER